MSDQSTQRTEPPLQPPDEARSTTSQGWLGALRSRLGLPGGQSLRETLEDALRNAPPGATFRDEEREMFLRLLRFGDLRVADVMVPRADIVAIDEDEPLSELLQTFVSGGISRIPLYRETLDDPRGMVHIKDLVSWLVAQSAGKIPPEPKAQRRPSPQSGMTEDMRSAIGEALRSSGLGTIDLSRPIASVGLRRRVLYVPPSMPAMNLLIRMQATRIHLALVVDEYGGTDGLVSIEDLVEQIVGDIEDEHDKAEEALITDDPKQGLIAAARTPVKELEVLLGMPLMSSEDAEYIDTLGGLVFSLVGRVPARGEIVRHPSGVEFEVLDADARRIKRLKIHRSGPAHTSPGSAHTTSGE
jgi:CBS domain containing-hemolysin-like protein